MERPVEVVKEREMGRIASQLQRHLQVPTKCPKKVHPSLHCRQEASEFQLAVKSPQIRGEALGFVLHWNHRAEIHPIPSQRRNTFYYCMSCCFRISSVVLMTPAIHLVFESECTSGKGG